jgi:tetratricopeptide (TPR) repeat protein
VDWRFGAALVYAGQSKRAIKVLETYMRLDPFYAPVALGILGRYMLKQYSQALPLLREFVSRAPKNRSSHIFLAATYAQSGHLEEARTEVAEILQIQRNYTISGTARLVNAFKRAKDDKHFLDGLRKAGLPEYRRTDYREALGSEEFVIVEELTRKRFALDFYRAMKAKAAASGGPPAVGLHVIIGPAAPERLGNMIPLI